MKKGKVLLHLLLPESFLVFDIYIYIYKVLMTSYLAHKRT